MKLYFIYLLLTILLWSQQASAIENIAHRGFSGKYLENSIEAVNESWGAGATIVEVDLRITSDGVVVLFHDDKIGNEDVGRMALKELEVKSNRTVPSFASVLESIPADGILLLDLKDGSAVFLEALMADVTRSKNVSMNQLLFQSRSFDVLDRIRKAHPQARCVCLTSLDYSRGKAPSAEDLVEKLLEQKLYGVTAKGRKFVDESFIKVFQAEGLKYFVWTINESDRLRHYQELGVDGIITDHPDRLMSILD